MTVATEDFAAWMKAADIPPSRLTAELDALLQAVFRFRQQQGGDYYSTRLLSHFLLHCGCGLKVAQIARLLGISRPCASQQQKLSSREVIQQAHHRMDGRPYGKLLPRYVGPIAGYLLAHPDASRAELLDFIERTFSVRVSRIALYKFLKKYGLQEMAHPAQSARGSANLAAPQSPAATAAASVAGAAAFVGSFPQTSPERLGYTDPVDAAPPAAAPAQTPPSLQAATGAGELLLPVLPPPPPFSTDTRSTPAPSF
jgi:hypothetical protein